MRLTRSGVLLTLAVLGCGGNPVTGAQAVQNFGVWAAEYGCDSPAAGKGVSAATERTMRKGVTYQPEVGWDACELMFALGYPDEKSPKRWKIFVS